MTRAEIIALNKQLHDVRMCTECEQVFPKTEDHYTYTDKRHLYFRPECKQCRADAKREVYQSDPAYYAWLMRCDRMQKALEKGLHGVVFPSLAQSTLPTYLDQSTTEISAVPLGVSNGR